ncbi:MAG: hypothetical protein VW270_04800 [Candidatus Poseidoniales archaeon]
MTLTDQQKRYLLLTYLNKYLSKKGLRMISVVRSIKDRLQMGRPITEKQFFSIIKFIERERPFVNKSREQITFYFEPLIQPIIKETTTNDSYNLTQFFEPQIDQLQRTDLPDQQL